MKLIYTDYEIMNDIKPSLTKDPCFSSYQRDLGSGTGFPVWCDKGMIKHNFFFPLDAFAFMSRFFSALPQSFSTS
jgi:hypothetical protein